MTKNFDEICKGILSEMVAAPTQQKPAGTQPAAPQAGAQPAVQQNAQQNNQIKDEDLLKLLQQKLADQKFKQSLMQLLNPPQQQNAANQPVQKA